MSIGQRGLIWRVGVRCTAWAAWGWCASAVADVDVALLSETPAVLAGDTVRLRLVLTADSPDVESFASLRIILAWDPTQLRLTGQDRTGTVSLLTSGFPRDPSNLNEATIPQDGDASYVAFAPLGNAIEVDQEGALITTLLFEALGPAPAATVSIPVSGGLPATVTAVFDGTQPNLHITGTLSGAHVPVFEEPTRFVLTLPDHPVHAGHSVTATLAMENLNGQQAAGFAAYLAFNPAELTFIEGSYTAAPFGSTLIAPIVGNDGTLDLAAAISSPGQSPSSADAMLAVLTFEAVQGGCVSSLRFRAATPSTRLTTEAGAPIGPLVLVDPLPLEPAACECPCDLDGVVGIDVFDLLAYLDLWFAGEPGAEWTGQGGASPAIDVFDLLAYLDCWFAPPAACP